MTLISMPGLIILIVAIAFLRLAFGNKAIKKGNKKSDLSIDENILDHFQDQ